MDEVDVQTDQTTALVAAIPAISVMSWKARQVASAWILVGPVKVHFARSSDVLDIQFLITERCLVQIGMVINYFFSNDQLLYQ